MAVHLLIVVYGLERIAAGISRSPRHRFGKEGLEKQTGGAAWGCPTVLHSHEPWLHLWRELIDKTITQKLPQENIGCFNTLASRQDHLQILSIEQQSQ